MLGKRSGPAALCGQHLQPRAAAQSRPVHRLVCRQQVHPGDVGAEPEHGATVHSAWAPQGPRPLPDPRALAVNAMSVPSPQVLCGWQQSRRSHCEFSTCLLPFMNSITGAFLVRAASLQRENRREAPPLGEQAPPRPRLRAANTGGTVGRAGSTGRHHTSRRTSTFLHSTLSPWAVE